MDNNKPKSSLSLINYITGISDGLLLPLIPCSLLFLSNATYEAFVWFNIAIFLGAIAYGFARFLGESQEIKHNHPGIAKQELLEDEKRLKQIGIDESLVGEMMQQVGEEQELWLREVKENDMGWEDLDLKRAGRSGVQTGLGFLIGAYLAILPFFLSVFKANFILLFVSAELLLMFLFGWLKGKYIYKNPFRYGILQLLKGILLFLCLGIVIFFLAGWFF